VRLLQHRWTELSPITLFGAADDDPETDPQEGANDNDDGDDKPVIEDKFSQDYVEGLRKEAASHRVKGKEQTARADKAEAALAEIKKAEMSDLDAVKTDLETANARAETAETAANAATSQLKTERIQNAVTMAALEAGFEDPTDALSMISQDDLVDDEGNIKAATVTKRLKSLGDKKPYLLKPSGAGRGDGGGRGKGTDPDSPAEKRAAHLKEFEKQGRVVV